VVLTVDRRVKLGGPIVIDRTQIKFEVHVPLTGGELYLDTDFGRTHVLVGIVA
jgi:hypothetical protein